jgi:putative redox protein
MTSSSLTVPPIATAIVAGDVRDGATFFGHAGESEFTVGGPEEYGGTATGPNPYDLLSASLAACTVMTIRYHARHKKYPLDYVEVLVSYHHAKGVAHGSFERVITLQGKLSDLERAELMRGAIGCPVAKTLEHGSQIDTRLTDQEPIPTAQPLANYFDDLVSLINIDPD